MQYEQPTATLRALGTDIDLPFHGMCVYIQNTVCVCQAQSTLKV